MALCQLFAIVQLFNPLVELLEGRLLLHSRILRNDFERVFEAVLSAGAGGNDSLVFKSSKESFAHAAPLLVNWAFVGATWSSLAGS